MDTTTLVGLAVPASCWVIAHFWALFVPAPSASANVVWKAVYSFLNIAIAANYKNSQNSNVVQELDAVAGKVTLTQ